MADEIGKKLRERIAERANRKCEYCRIHEDDTGSVHHVDHIVLRKHGGPTALLNLAYACAICNRRKGTDLASIDHRIGQMTIRTLKLNAAERVEEKRGLQELGRYPAEDSTNTALNP